MLKLSPKDKILIERNTWNAEENMNTYYFFTTLDVVKLYEKQSERISEETFYFESEIIDFINFIVSRCKCIV